MESVGGKSETKGLPPHGVGRQRRSVQTQGWNHSLARSNLQRRGTEQRSAPTWESELVQWWEADCWLESAALAAEMDEELLLLLFVLHPPTCVWQQSYASYADALEDLRDDPHQAEP